FFQAEDGIRDKLVTGVQTCALPIFLRHQCFQLGFGPLVLQKGLPRAAENPREFRPRIRRAHIDDPDGLDSWLWRFDTEQARRLRSEERRVGKECRARGSRGTETEEE